ncbi:MAG: hypothetical protein M5U28_17450 [Sandaracinaceae bacterium]|nr:hypothetical protein [Sandaracinaceae bacterium]
MRSRSRWLLVVCALSACAEPAVPAARDAGRGPEVAAPLEPAAPAAPSEPAAAAVAPREVRAGEVVEVPAGALRAGSLPGTPGRRPSVEADLAEVALGAFSIDRLPYPNDPAQAPRLVASRREAAALCEAQGRRLCTELEWERACKGDGAASFPTGEAMDLEACAADAAACGSPLGVLDLGVRAPEWTASDAEARLARLERTVVARGASEADPPHAHRCAARAAVAPEGGRPLAFRCCGGEAPAVAYPDVGLRRLFRDLTLEVARAREILAAVPALARFAPSFAPYDVEDARRALARGGATEASTQWELAPGPFAWSPSPGEEVWVIAGRVADGALLAALYPMPDGTFLHAASFVLEGEDAPFAVLRTRSSRSELLWTTCWGCVGEGGAIRFDEESRIVIAQQ